MPITIKTKVNSKVKIIVNVRNEFYILEVIFDLSQEIENIWISCKSYSPVIYLGILGAMAER